MTGSIWIFVGFVVLFLGGLLAAVRAAGDEIEDHEYDAPEGLWSEDD